MNVIFAREADRLKESLLRQAGDVEQRLHAVLAAIDEKDNAALREWMARDSEIDEREVAIEEECLKILALHQPVARDLRFVVAVLKINNDLERIGDIVVNIAERGLHLVGYPANPLWAKPAEMGRKAADMLRESIDAMIELDTDKVETVLRGDDAVDRLNAEVIREVIDRFSREAGGKPAEALMMIHGIARDLERIGDHATNIAEDVAYLANGAIIRHHKGIDGKG